MTDTLLGKVASGPITADAIQVWPLQANARRVTYETAELQALCPVTRQPDVYHATIWWDPGGHTLESKAVKHYLWRFRDEGIGCEDLASTIADDLSRRLDVPVNVTLVQQVRGGLTLTAEAEGWA